MKIIESAGGPLIGIHRDHLRHWSGTFGRKFFLSDPCDGTDYDVLCSIVISDPEIVISKIEDHGVEIFFIASEPLPTLIVGAGSKHVYIAQIYSSEEGWSESQLCSADFERAIEWQQPTDFRSPGGEVVFFDSAGRCPDADNEHLSFNLDEGLYTCDWSQQKWEGRANLIFVRMMRRAV